MSTSFYADLNRTLSAERLTGYHNPSDRDKFANYMWNIALCEALYPVLQGVEVAVRNSLHEAATAEFGTPWWFDSTGPIQLRGYRSYQKKGTWRHRYEANKVEYAKDNLCNRGKTLTPGKVIAELTFGFWTSLFNRYYAQPGRLWPKLLVPVFPHGTTGRTIGVVRGRMENIRDLRNRVFHHEPIWHRGDLYKQYEEAVEIIAWVCPSMLKLISSVDRFPQVYKSGRTDCCANMDIILASLPK